MIYAAACRFLNKTPSWDVMTQLQDSQLDPHLKFTSDDVAGLWNLVNQVYRVDEDSARLRDSMSLDAGPRALEFDRQRKEYPKRREFNYYDIRQSDVTTAQGHMLEQLGFRISH
jgi:hypothetical protein